MSITSIAWRNSMRTDGRDRWTKRTLLFAQGFCCDPTHGVSVACPVGALAVSRNA